MNQKKKKKKTPKQDKKASLGYLETVSLKMISSAPGLQRRDLPEAASLPRWWELISNK